MGPHPAISSIDSNMLLLFTIKCKGQIPGELTGIFAAMRVRGILSPVQFVCEAPRKFVFKELGQYRAVRARKIASGALHGWSIGPKTRAAYL